MTGPATSTRHRSFVGPLVAFGIGCTLKGAVVSLAHAGNQDMLRLVLTDRLPLLIADLVPQPHLAPNPVYQFIASTIVIAGSGVEFALVYVLLRSAARGVWRLAQSRK
jgi:hypothetical protein